jgi:hypothetical protein
MGDIAKHFEVKPQNVEVSRSSQTIKDAKVGRGIKDIDSLKQTWKNNNCPIDTLAFSIQIKRQIRM